MTSFGMTEINEGNCISTFNVTGQVCYLIGFLLPVKKRDIIVFTNILCKWLYKTKTKGMQEYDVK